MSNQKLEQLRQTIGQMLTERGHGSKFSETDSLFDSGRLDSMSAVNLLMELEQVFDIDLSDPDFDISQIDTFEQIVQLVSQDA
ncbi:MAG: phosphopantetheine-binding protein [Pseudomonadota bacterium]